MGDFRTEDCKGSTCEQKVIWAVTPEGKKICVSARGPCYMIVEDGKGGYLAIRERNCYVTHFATCKNPEEFSTRGSRRHGNPP